MARDRTAQVLQDMATVSGADLHKVARNFARDITKELIKHTPKARNKKYVQYVPAKTRDGRPITRNGEPVMVPLLDDDGKIVREKVPGIGYLKAAWLANLERLGVPPKSRVPVLAGAKDASRVERRETRTAAEYDIVNAVEYARRVNDGSENNEASHFMRRAEQSVQTKWEERIEKMAKKKIERWRGKQLRKVGIKL